MTDSIKAEVTELTAELAKLAAYYPEQLKRLILSVCEMATHAANRIEADTATIARLEGERDAIERLYMSECEAFCEAHEAMLTADDARIAAEAKVAALEWFAEISAEQAMATKARTAIAAAKGDTEIPADAENGRATDSRMQKGDVSQSSAD